MARRDADSEVRHDAIVKQIATALEETWADVYAVDVPTKHGSPSEIDGYRPDVMARSGGETLVVEVETDPEDDPEQRQAFREWASADSERSYVGVHATDYDSWAAFESVGDGVIEE